MFYGFFGLGISPEEQKLNHQKNDALTRKNATEWRICGFTEYLKELSNNKQENEVAIQEIQQHLNTSRKQLDYLDKLIKRFDNLIELGLRKTAPCSP